MALSQTELATFSFVNDIYMWGGIVLGFLLSGSLNQILRFIFNGFERPRRIKFRNLNGREERKDNFEYLYLYRGSYYTLEQRDFLRKERLKNIKPMNFNLKFFVFLFLLLPLLFFKGF